jgi:internalin A
MKKKIFISYSRKDVEYKDELKKHLNMLKTFDIADNWSCDEITISKWHEQLQKELKESDLIIYMLSANFLVSGYILDQEVKKGMYLIGQDPNKKVLCVIVSDFVGLDDLKSFSNKNLDDLQKAVLQLSDWQYLPYSKIVNNVTGNIEEKIIPLKRYQNIEEALTQIVTKVLDVLGEK